MTEQITNVLVVDDSRVDSRLLERMLMTPSPAPYKVSIVPSIADAELAVKRHEYDVILCDLTLPDSSGLQTFTRLHARAPRSPIIVISGTNDEQLAMQAVREGAQDYLVKGTFDSAALRRELRYAIERHQLRAALAQSEKHYRHLLEAITDFTYRVSLRNGKALGAEHSPTCVTVTGYSPFHYEQDPDLWLKMIPHEDQPLVLDQARRVLLGENVPPIEHRILHANGGTRWVRNAVVPHVDEAGRLIGYDGLIRDISARKIAEEQLVRSEVFYHSLVETLPQHIIRKDLNERFTFANHHFCELVGRTLNEVIGKTDFDFFDPELARKYQTDDREVIKSGKPMDVVEVNQAPGGDQRYVNVVKTPIYDARRRIIGIQGIFWDITEKKRAEEQLRKANEELLRSHQELKSAQLQLIQAAKMESVGTLAAGVAHEVKNPLAILTMGINYLQRNIKDPDDNLTLVIREMHDAVGRADKVTLELLDFSAARQLDRQRENVNALLEQTLVLLRHTLNERRITLDTRFQEGLPEVAVEKRQIQQVFVNILMNAVQALEGGGRITISTEAQRLSRSMHSEGARSGDQMFIGENVVVTTFEDNGPGIPEENLAKIFDPFFTTKPTGIGTGLGLPVSKKIVELHGGAIEISNKVGGGARVAVTLRAERPHEKESPAD
jgi:PAS domain S-box-containing protein